MIRIRLFFVTYIICLLSGFHVLGKEVKPKVLIYGDNIGAFSAALQSARSSVPTIWVLPSKTFCEGCFSMEKLRMVNDTLGGGIWSVVLREASLQQSKQDSIDTMSCLDLDPQVILDAMHSLILKEGNLSVVYEHRVSKIVNNLKNIDVELSNKKKYTLNAVVDFSEDLGVILDSKGISRLDTEISLSNSSEQLINLDNNSIRTLVAIGYKNEQLNGYTLKSLLDNANGNLFFTERKGRSSSIDDNIIYQLNIGQALGASAAYCAFFKTTSDKIDVRKLQTELLSFGARILPFDDVSVNDSNFNALQKFFLTEILPWDKSSHPLSFNSDDSVSIETVKPVIQQYYSRAQLWFVENKETYFTVKDVIALIKVISFRSSELDDEVKKAWKRRFKFESDFQADKIVSRYEFAVLMDAYASPFAKKITLDGFILR